MYVGQLQLNATRDTTFNSIPAYEDITSLITTKVTIAILQSGKIITQYKCVNCHKNCKFEQNQQNPIIKCSFCNMKKKLQVSKSLYDEPTNLSTKQWRRQKVCFYEALNDYIIRNDLQKKSNDELEDHYEEYEKKSDVVISIQ